MPCQEWLNLFENGQIDAHEAFKVHGQQYNLLYVYTDIDLIRWEIENGVFDWQKNAWAVARYCPDLMERMPNF